MATADLCCNSPWEKHAIVVIFKIGNPQDVFVAKEYLYDLVLLAGDMLEIALSYGGLGMQPTEDE